MLRAFRLLVLGLSAGVAAVAGAEPVLRVERILVDGKAQVPDGDGVLRLSPGAHRLGFALRVENPEGAMRVRATLKGLEDDWREVSDEMRLEAEFLSPDGQVVGGQRIPFTGATPGYLEDLTKATFVYRREPLLVPPGSARFRLTFSSGDASTTGVAVLDELTLNLPGGSTDPKADLMRNSGFSGCADGNKTISGSPDGWRRGGSRREMAHYAQGPKGDAIALVDDDPAASAAWITELDLDGRVTPGEALSLSWASAWAVNPGTVHTLSYQGVDGGEYELRVAAIAVAGGWTGASTSLRIVVERHVWEHAWFWPAIVGSGLALLAGASVLLIRQRLHQRLDLLAAQHALEKDRSRIARDMHDDLGARLTRISLITAMAEREIRSGDSPAALAHAGQLARLSREVVSAIDEIVWAVDPGNDTLDHLGTRLCRFADEFLSGSPVRCRYGIPAVLPAVHLGAEVRHNLFLAVKEALNNVLKHAAPCEARLDLQLSGRVLTIEISDQGGGSGKVPGVSGNGLRNMERRMHDVGGTCTVARTPQGTRVILTWPLPDSAAVS